MTLPIRLAELDEDRLLNELQRRTFDYFWRGAHPSNGCAYDRRPRSGEPAGDLIAVGGTGFGLIALVVGENRGWLSRAHWLERLEIILSFLERCDRFHGAFPHFVHGETGQVIRNGRRDDGADLVETGLLFQGLIVTREYLSAGSSRENSLRTRIDALWRAVEWCWFARGGDGLYWHWSPRWKFGIGLRIEGWNEALIAYAIAAASPTFAIDPAIYHSGFARDGAMRNGKQFHGIDLPLGMDGGGPLFFAHFSFCGIDPRGLSDRYADYWMQNLNHARINRAHCIANPHDYPGYGPDCWGLSACHARRSYNAYSPTADAGVIAPSAALSSFPYLPIEAMQALRGLAARPALWGRFGVMDSFSDAQRWTARSHLAISQGPIVAMIENHRSGLVWELFMQSPEARYGLNALGFTTRTAAAHP